MFMVVETLLCNVCFGNGTMLDWIWLTIPFAFVNRKKTEIN